MIVVIILGMLKCFVAPAALGLGGVAAGILGAASLVVSLLAAVPGTLVTAWMTGATRKPVRVLGWLGLTGAVLVAIGALAGTVIAALVVAAAIGLSPEWGCGVL